MEEMAFAKERSFKRKLMKAQVATASGGSGDDGVGGQVRRVHIIYFLSRNGRMEHPHLIRIHHLSRNGVHLRDIKSWLSELRGKDMPESFAWSYKRYKGGYVWQDILDEDLITPICDNEYVLKGSEISSTTLNNDINSYGGKEDFDLQKSSFFEGNTNDPRYPSTRKEYSLDFSTNFSIENQESSFGSNVTTEDTTRNHQDEYKHHESLQNPNDKNKNINNHFLNNNNVKNYDDMNDNNSTNNKSNKGGDKTDCFEAPRSPPTRKSGRASHMFRNWITCGTANTNEKALVVINKRKGSAASTVSSVSEKNNGKENDVGRICKEQKLRGFEKSFDTRDGSKKSKKEESNNFKTFAAAYKPVNGPNCSQCGRQFKPEKLHNHMRYCRGMKAMSKSANARPKPKISRPHSPSSKSFDTFYLTDN